MTSLTQTGMDDRLRDFFYAYDRALPLNAMEEVVEETDEYTKLHVTFASTHDEVVPATLHLHRQQSGLRPALLLQHGASTKKDDHYIQQPARRWSEAGYVCLAIDAPGHGERAGESPASRRELARRGLLHRMRDMFVQGVVDLMRALDYLEARPEVDVARIGYMGVSMGTFLGVPLCGMDRRLRSAAFIIGGGNLRRLPGSRHATGSEEAELAYQVTDPVVFAPRISPRPVLMLNGEQDETIPRASTEALYEALREPKEIRWFNMGHTVSGVIYRQTFEFFEETLSV